MRTALFYISLALPYALISAALGLPWWIDLPAFFAIYGISAVREAGQ